MGVAWGGSALSSPTLSSPKPGNDVADDDVQGKNQWSKKRSASGIPLWAVALGRILGVFPLYGPVPALKRSNNQPIDLPADFDMDAPSITARIPWRWTDPANKQIVGVHPERRFVFFEIYQADTETLSDDDLVHLSEQVTHAVRALPEESPSWNVQIFLQDEPVQALAHRIHAYIGDHAGHTAVGDAWFTLIEEHLTRLSHPDGYFIDPKTHAPWGARYRRLRGVLYRDSVQAKARRSTTEELNQTAARWFDGLKEAGIHASRLSGSDIYEWLSPWFSPSTGQKQGQETDNVYQYLETFPYPKDAEASGDLSAAFDLAQMCFRNRPVASDTESGTWSLNHSHNRYLSLVPPLSKPRIGHWTRKSDSGQPAHFDRLPEGSVLSIAFTALPQDEIRNQLDLVAKKTFGDTAEARQTKAHYDKAQTLMAEDHHIVGAQLGIYLSAQSETELRDKTGQAETIAASAGFTAINPDVDPLAVDCFARSLPGCWGWPYDQRQSKRARMAWDSHLARLLPVYGSGTGTGNPGFVYWNPVGEPFTYDILNPADRRKNGHLFLFGQTGTGKTATLIGMLMQAMAVHRPRLFIITALPTFGLLGDWFKRHGLTVNHVRVDPKNPISLPPFADAMRLLDADTTSTDNNDDDCDGGDYQGQMELIARLMITGGHSKEEAEFSRPDEGIVREAILLAANHCRDSGQDQVLTEHVADALMSLSRQPEKSEKQRERISDMAAAMSLFCSGKAGEFFNRPGHAWPDVDVTIVELGVFARSSYEDLLAVTMVGLMNRINDRVESVQYNNRQAITLIDEAHVLIKNALLSPYLKAMAAMWRTYGSWLWIATQSMKQFPEQAKELLDLPEWWICLNMERSDLEEIKKFKDLTPAQETLLLAARKEPGYYTEGVVMSRAATGLFRVVSPLLTLTLGQTEKHEKTHRADLMRQHNVSELDAAELVAQELAPRHNPTK